MAHSIAPKEEAMSFIREPIANPKYATSLTRYLLILNKNPGECTVASRELAFLHETKQGTAISEVLRASGGWGITATMLSSLWEKKMALAEEDKTHTTTTVSVEALDKRVEEAMSLLENPTPATLRGAYEEVMATPLSLSSLVLSNKTHDLILKILYLNESYEVQPAPANADTYKLLQAIKTEKGLVVLNPFEGSSEDNFLKGNYSLVFQAPLQAEKGRYLLQYYYKEVSKIHLIALPILITMAQSEHVASKLKGLIVADEVFNIGAYILSNAPLFISHLRATNSLEIAPLPAQGFNQTLLVCRPKDNLQAYFKSPTKTLVYSYSPQLNIYSTTTIFDPALIKKARSIIHYLKENNLRDLQPISCYETPGVYHLWNLHTPSNTLANLLKTCNLSLFDRCLIAKALLKALSMLHIKGYRHRALDPNHIEVQSTNSNWVVRFTHLGNLAKETAREKASYMTTEAAFQPPENGAILFTAFMTPQGGIVHSSLADDCSFYDDFQNKPFFGLEKNSYENADLWTLGILLHRLLLNEYPFWCSKKTDEAVIESLKHLDSDWNISLKTHGFIGELIAMLLEVNPSRRVSAASAYMNFSEHFDKWQIETLRQFWVKERLPFLAFFDPFKPGTLQFLGDLEKSLSTAKLNDLKDPKDPNWNLIGGRLEPLSPLEKVLLLKTAYADHTERSSAAFKVEEVERTLRGLEAPQRLPPLKFKKTISDSFSLSTSYLNGSFYPIRYQIRSNAESEPILFFEQIGRSPGTPLLAHCDDLAKPFWQKKMHLGMDIWSLGIQKEGTILAPFTPESLTLGLLDCDRNCYERGVLFRISPTSFHLFSQGSIPRSLTAGCLKLFLAEIPPQIPTFFTPPKVQKDCTSVIRLTMEYKSDFQKKVALWGYPLSESDIATIGEFILTHQNSFYETLKFYQERQKKGGHRFDALHYPKSETLPCTLNITLFKNSLLVFCVFEHENTAFLYNINAFEIYRLNTQVFTEGITTNPSSALDYLFWNEEKVIIHRSLIPYEWSLPTLLEHNRALSGSLMQKLYLTESLLIALQELQLRKKFPTSLRLNSIFVRGDLNSYIVNIGNKETIYYGTEAEEIKESLLNYPHYLPPELMKLIEPGLRGLPENLLAGLFPLVELPLSLFENPKAQSEYMAWQLGLLLHEFFYKKLFTFCEERILSQVIKEVIEFKEDPIPLEGSSHENEMASVINALLIPDPARRLNLESALIRVRSILDSLR